MSRLSQSADAVGKATSKLDSAARELVASVGPRRAEALLIATAERISVAYLEGNSARTEE